MFTKTQEFVAELVGTMILILLGLGVVSMVNIFPGDPKGGFTNVTIGWGLAVTFGIYFSGRISGAHINPAVTLGLAATKRFPWSKVWYYIVAQMIGAFIAAAIVFAVYYRQWIITDPGFEKTAVVFATRPAVPGFLSGLCDQIVGTAILMACILAVGDKNNTPPGANMSPLIIGLIVVAIGISFGGMHGYAINPARDLAPRIFSVIAGFKNNGLTDGSGIWIVPVLGPSIGGILGAFVYDLTVGKIMNKENADEPIGEEEVD